MKKFLLIIWLIAIFIGTCTKNVHALLMHGEVEFVFVSQPKWIGAFSFYPLSEISKFETTGHVIMFFILSILLVEVLEKPAIASVIALSFGITIEFVQPYFTRGADVYDVLADLLGITACLIVWGINRKKDKRNYYSEKHII